MRKFGYRRAKSCDDAIAGDGEVLLAGGTTLLDLWKCGVVRPDAVIDISSLPGLNDIALRNGRLHIGALATMAAVARHELVRRHAPAVAIALDLSASQQIRNMASIGGNLMQRTRCAYFRDPATYTACNKRMPGSGCAARGGITHNHAILGTSPDCLATYPGDLAVALSVLQATVHLTGRDVALQEFFLTLDDGADQETVLRDGEMILAISVSADAIAARSVYLKVRDRQSYEFAAASAAAALEFEPDTQIVRDIRIAVGGVATRPWRLPQVEAMLSGRLLDEAAISRAAARSAESAVLTEDNHHKAGLLCQVVARAIRQAQERT